MRSDHQQTLLTIASLLRKKEEEDEYINSSLTAIQDNISSLNLEVKEVNRAKAITTISVDSNSNIKENKLVVPVLRSKNRKETEKEDNSSHQQENIHKNDNETCGKQKSSTKESSKTCRRLSALPTYRRKRDRRRSDSETIKRAQSGVDMLSDDLNLYQEQETKYGSLRHRKSLDTNTLIKKLEHGYEIRNLLVKTENNTKLKGKISGLKCSRSVYDLKYHYDNSNSLPEESIVDNGLQTKKKHKKLLNSDRKAMNTVSSLDNNSGLNQTCKPLSSSLLDSLSAILRCENIDLTCEPYSDNVSDLNNKKRQKLASHLKLPICSTMSTKPDQLFILFICLTNSNVFPFPLII